MHFLPPPQYAGSCFPVPLSPSLQGLLLPYAKGIQTEGDFGTVISQVFKGADFEIFKHHFFISKEISLFAYSNKPILTMNFMLRGSPIARVPGMGELQLTQETYQFFYVPSKRIEMWFPKGNFETMNIVLTPAYIERFAKRHKGLNKLIACVTKASDQLFLHERGTITPLFRRLVEEMVPNYENRATTEFKAQTVIKKIFISFIMNHYHKGQFQVGTIEKLEMVKEYIDSNLDNQLSVSAIAEFFHCSVPTLQRQFTEHFGQPIHEYFLEKRMERGMMLLLENNYSIGQISDLLGYKNPSSFIGAFNRSFGFPPAHFMRHRQSYDEK